MTEKIILGIDPGTTIMGYGLIKCVGKHVELMHFGVVNLSKVKDTMLKLKMIFERSLHLIEQYKPDELAIESQFYGKNVQSMLKLGRAQGTSIAAALYRDIPIFEYAPKRIKQAITGNGNASKEQVAAMLTRLLNINEVPEFLDATDGLAVAMAHFYTGDKISKSDVKSYSSWESFISTNQSRIVKRKQKE